MENYVKKSTRKIICSQLDIQENHIKISPGGRPKDYISVFRKMTEKGATQVDITGVGMAINKAVSVVEILKRSFQSNCFPTIFEVEQVDLWESINGDLDSIEVSRFVPAIKFTIIIQGS